MIRAFKTRDVNKLLRIHFFNGTYIDCTPEHKFMEKNTLNDTLILQITEIIEECMRNHKNIINPTVEDILATEQSVYEQIESRW